MKNEYLFHHGILGQKWGQRNGPPYPLGGGDYTQLERSKITKKRLAVKNSIYNKKHFDETLKKEKTTLSTLSYDKDRTKNADMFYATHKALDKHQYNALFNRPIPKPIYDKDGNEIGTGHCFKYKIDNSLKHDIKIASEDSAADIFMKLYKKDRDFYNFVTDEKRMQSYFVDDKYKFKGYRESRDVLNQMRKNKSYTPTSEDLQKVYRMFNCVIPYDGGGSDSRGGHDTAMQRAKFFNECKNKGYSGVLDTNDAIYGAFKAKSPVIIFNTNDIIPKSIKETSASSKGISSLALAGRKALGV